VTMILAIVAAFLAVLAVLLMTLLVGGRRRLEATMRELGYAKLDRSIDLDEVLSRTVEAAGSLPGADAALVSVEESGGKPLLATCGLSPEEAECQAVAEGRDGHARSISITYRNDEPSPNGDRIRSGIAVPLQGEEGEFGFVAILTRSGCEFDDGVVSELQELATRAGPAIDNAKRFRDARQLADLDALTSLHNRRYFHETLAREVARAQRYGRKLTLIVFDLDDFKAVNDRVGHLAGDSVLADAAERVRDVVRSADIACRVGGDEFAVILPESTLADADQLYRRIQAAVSTRPIAQVEKLHLSAGVAELRPEDSGATLFERADEALYRAKNAGKDQIVAAS
jgi:diguanylate cyclase (GGDEF)-like protein